LVGDCSSPTLAFVVTMRGMTRAMFDLVERPSLVHALMEKGVAIAAEKGKFNIDLGLKVLRINDSVANMSVISPDHWRAFVLPHMRDLCTELHDYDPEVLLYCHICGNVLPVIDDLVDTGLDCIGPLDPLGGFSCGAVRERVRDRVSLLGGVDTQTFVRGQPDQIEDEARRCIAEAGAAGGFVLGSGCVIPRTARRDNLVALTRAADLYGRYTDGDLTMDRRT
jgi:uroporphyrinogen-III decarboxylase